MARSVLDANRRVGAAQLPPVAYDYTCPSTQTYPFQWNWDSAFHAIALARYDPQRAQAEISSLLAAKQPSGFLPHVVLWQEEFRTRAADEFTIAVDPAGWHTVTTQPPVLPLAVERVWQAGRDERWLDQVLPDVVDAMSWWRTRRDATHTGLVTTFQPDESGLDMSPKYDALLGILPGLQGNEISLRWHAAMRELFAAYGVVRDPDDDLSRHGRFVWQDVMVNSVYADSARALARLLDERGRPDAAADWRQIAANTTAALLRDCWDEPSGAFYDTLSKFGRVWAAQCASENTYRHQPFPIDTGRPSLRCSSASGRPPDERGRVLAALSGSKRRRDRARIRSALRHRGDLPRLLLGQSELVPVRRLAHSRVWRRRARAFASHEGNGRPVWTARVLRPL